ncbi:hypothetical protein K7X08_010646 [Anisodus acutangulus]|uniref:Uncharacterized protein n=1 Tax=Anisodus acutangulus TaxID=402998 RepID=A0A9Q1LX96_9SOLA|nr:hypothetical protein K7X08_010646 [Anisodus acutangulus]
MQSLNRHRHDRKRKSIMEGQFTRSKSQIYLHCNRSGRVRVDSTRSKHSNHQLRQLDPPVKKTRRIFVENLEGFSDLCDVSQTPIKDLRARRVFSPATSIALENDDNLKKSELPLFDEKNEIESNGQNGGNVSIPKSNSAVSSSSRRKVFIAPSSFSYRRLLPYLTDAAREYTDVSEIETHDTPSKSNNPTLSYLKPDPRSTASNGSTSEDKHVGAKTLGSVEGQKIECNVSWGPKDLDDVPDVLSKTQVESRVFTNGGGLDPEALEECVQTTPPDADSFYNANVSDLETSIEHNAEQTEKKIAGHPSDRRNGCVVKKPRLTPGRNGSVSRNKLALNPCSRLKVFKAVSSVSYRRLLPFLMDVAKNDPGGAASENGIPKFQQDLDCNRPLMSVSKEIPTNENGSPKKDEIKEQETKLLEPKCTSANDVSESFNKTPSSVFPDDVASPQTLLNVEIKRKSEIECTDTSDTEMLDPECLNNEINNFNTGADNVGPETSVAIPNLLPISLEDLLREYGVEDPKVEPVSPEGDRMILEVDCNEENRNSGDPTGTVEIHADANEALKRELFLKISEPEPINNESSCKVLLADSNGDSGAHNAVALITSSSSPEPSDPSRDGNDGPTKTLCSESIQEITQSSDNLNKNGCLEPAICHQKSTQNESSSYDLVTRPDVLNKGILKRNPRGCRGLCNCLNCASYRLHAERAFEFSRNQMQDTEEVSLGLMKELADMRIFLEKHLSTENGLAPIPLTQVEVEEACAKALEAEQRAKEHLGQMNNELNYHCRIPSFYRPRVTFATHIEAKAVAKDRII